MNRQVDYTNAVGSVSFNTMLFTVFLVLKLCGLITWSWWWVTAPLWLPIAVLLAIAGFAVLMIRWGV